MSYTVNKDKSGFYQLSDKNWGGSMINVWVFVSHQIPWDKHLGELSCNCYENEIVTSQL